MRIAIGLSCVFVGFVQSDFIANDLVATLVGVFGLINIAAAAVSNCPVYSLAGLSTYKQKADNA